MKKLPNTQLSPAQVPTVAVGHVCHIYLSYLNQIIRLWNLLLAEVEAAYSLPSVGYQRFI